MPSPPHLSSTVDDAPPDLPALARHYGPRVLATAYRVLGDLAQAEDVQQDVFLRVLERPPRDVASWSAWLGATTTRLAIDRLRRRHRRERLLGWFGAGQPQASAAAADEAIADEQLRRLRQALTRLKPREAEIFALRHAEDMAVGDIAAALGISANLASVTLHRATRRLRDALDG